MLSLTAKNSSRPNATTLCLPAKMLSLTVLDRLQSMESIVFTRKNAVTNSRGLRYPRRQVIVFTRKNAVTNSKAIYDLVYERIVFTRKNAVTNSP